MTSEKSIFSLIAILCLSIASSRKLIESFQYAAAMFGLDLRL